MSTKINGLCCISYPSFQLLSKRGWSGKGEGSFLQYRSYKCFPYFYRVMRLCIWLLLAATVKGQDLTLARNAFMNRDMNEAIDYWHISRPQKNFHASFRPFLYASLTAASDSVVPFRFYGFKNAFLIQRLGVHPKNKTWTALQYQPLAEVEAGWDGYSKRLLTSSSAGLQMRANFNDNVTVCGTARGGRAWLPYFLDTVVKYNKVLPGIGQAYGSSRAGYAWSDFTGYVSWAPNHSKVFNIQAGRDRHFIGDGYRSVLLSDYAPAYWYYRMSARFWRMQYSVWYSWLKDIEQAAGIKNNYRNKYGTFHYLSYNITDNFNVSVFENVVWRGTDTGQVRSFDVNYLSPVVFFRPIEYANGSSDNSFMGLNTSLILFKQLKIYGQLGVDEFNLKYIRARNGWWANKQAWQLGAKYINAFGWKGFRLQVEYNQVRPYTYSHGLVDQNYGHNGLPLAHPYGANFKELLGIAGFRREKFEISWQGGLVVMGRDSSASSNVGQNIFMSYSTRGQEFGNYTGQGLKTTVLQNQLRVAWHVLPLLGARIEAGYVLRAEQGEKGFTLHAPYVYVGFRTAIFSETKDF